MPEAAGKNGRKRGRRDRTAAFPIQQPTRRDGEVLELLGNQVGVHPLVGCRTGSALLAQSEGAPHGEETTGIDADP